MAGLKQSFVCEEFGHWQIVESEIAKEKDFKEKHRATDFRKGYGPRAELSIVEKKEKREDQSSRTQQVMDLL
jgi:hypothetical protein